MTANGEPGTVRVVVRNLGGIDSREVTFDRGVTVLTGRNATNRTSLLGAISAGLGGSSGELKSDADEGEVELDFGDERYVRTFRRDGEGVTVTGDPLTDDESIVDLFSCLLGNNRARKAVERSDGTALRGIIMEPIDTVEIATEIERRRRDLREIETQIDETERRLSNFATLTERRRSVRNELDEVEATVRDVRNALDEFEADADAAEEAEAVVEELKAAREEYERVRNRLETQRNAVASLEDERERVRRELDDLPSPEAELHELEGELTRIRRRKRQLENTINNLLSIVEFNDRLVSDPTDALPGWSDDGGLVDELDRHTGTVECWTCGTTVERTAIATRLDDLRTVVDDLRRERNELDAEIEELRATLADRRDGVDTRASLEDQIDEITTEIGERDGRIDELVERTDALQERIDELEREAAESERLRESALLDRYQRYSELEYERGQLEEQLASIDQEIEELRALEAKQEELACEREEIRDEVSSLRDRITDLERSAIDAFNEHVQTVLDRLGYGNVERVWIERVSDAGDDGPLSERSFRLHVVRSTADGTMYEDTVDHLSESERAVVGLVVSLAGYLVHDIHRRVPIMVLDSLEAIDADRIASLVDYFADYAPYLIVALLPEDARALDDDYERVSMDEALA